MRDVKKYFSIERGMLRRTKGFVKAIDGISFSVKQNQTVGIVGRSGSGKSTLAKLLVRLMLPTSGTVVYDAAAIQHFRRDVQIIFQNPYQSLNPRMRIKHILEEPLIIHKLVDASNIKQLISATLESVGLNDTILQRFPIEFSGGQRQRICLARSLILKPKFLVLDEPVSSLDLTMQAEILDMLKRLKEEFKLTYLFITHNLNLLNTIADQILVIEKGRILQKLG